MPRSTLALAFPPLFAVLACACNRTSENPPVVTAPVTSSTPPAASQPLAAPASSPEAGVFADKGTASEVISPPDAGGAAAFQACQADSDCMAVPRVGCCHNGWKEAVNVAQKDAYAASFTCPRRPLCPMYMIRDARVPRCDPSTHLCAMVQPKP